MVDWAKTADHWFMQLMLKFPESQVDDGVWVYQVNQDLQVTLAFEEMPVYRLMGKGHYHEPIELCRYTSGFWFDVVWFVKDVLNQVDHESN